MYCHCFTQIKKKNETKKKKLSSAINKATEGSRADPLNHHKV